MAAMIWLTSPALIFAGMVLFGAGFGVTGSATFALLLDRLPEARASAQHAGRPALPDGRPRAGLD